MFNVGVCLGVKVKFVTHDMGRHLTFTCISTTRVEQCMDYLMKDP